MKNVQDGLGVQNISDLVLKEIYVIYKQKSLRKIKLENKKWLTIYFFFEKYANLSGNRLNEKNNKEFYAKNDVIKRY